MNDESAKTVDRVECRANRDPAVRLLIAAVMCLGAAIWCFLDAYVKGKYPKPESGDEEFMNKMAAHLFNHYVPFIAGVALIVLVVWAWKVTRRLIVADGTGLTVNGQAYAWGDFTGVDASRLPNKGLLVLKRAGGDDVRLDRYKYHNFKELVTLVEQHVTVDSDAGPTEAPEAAGSDDA